MQFQVPKILARPSKALQNPVRASDDTSWKAWQSKAKHGKARVTVESPDKISTEASKQRFQLPKAPKRFLDPPTTFPKPKSIPKAK